MALTHSPAFKANSTGCAGGAATLASHMPNEKQLRWHLQVQRGARVALLRRDSGELSVAGDALQFGAFPPHRPSQPCHIRDASCPIP
eukprot:15482163-Alexandrium_andersonii.AAC.1